MLAPHLLASKVQTPIFWAVIETWHYSSSSSVLEVAWDLRLAGAITWLLQFLPLVIGLYSGQNCQAQRSCASSRKIARFSCLPFQKWIAVVNAATMISNVKIPSKLWIINSEAPGSDKTAERQSISHCSADREILSCLLEKGDDHDKHASYTKIPFLCRRP